MCLAALLVGFLCGWCDGIVVVGLWWIRAFMLEDNGGVKDFKCIGSSLKWPSIRIVRSGITKFISFCFSICFYHNPTIIRIPTPSFGFVSILKLVPGFVGYFHFHLVAHPFGPPCYSLRVPEALFGWVLGMLVPALEFLAMLAGVVLPFVRGCCWLGPAVFGFAAASTSSRLVALGGFGRLLRFDGRIRIDGGSEG